MSLKGKLKYLILDESDRLLDMGLGSQVEQIVQHVRANQPGSGSNGVTWRSLLVSATVSQKEQALAKSLLGCSDEWDWARGGCDQKVQDTSDLFDSTPRQLSQLHMTVTAKLRLASLVAFLAQRVNKAERVVVFMATCDGVDYHHALFSAMECILPSKNEDTQMSIFGSSCPIHKLHGNIPHAERQTVLSKFNSGSSAILLATDVAARGLNLLRVDWTIQYDPPCEVADYAHRAGRAARAGQAGHSLIFLLPTERQFLEVLELKGLKQMKALSLANTLSRAAEICAELSDESKTGHRNKGEAFALEIQHRFENLVVQDDASVKAHYPAPPRKKGQPRPPEPCGKLLELARRAFFSYIKSYPTKEKIVRHIFSSRALHVGHIARSFALKEPPKSSINKVISGQKEEIDSNRKRMLIFDKNDHESEQRKRQGVQHHAKPGAILDTAKARMMLMERAKQLQQGGMESL
jgi:ATP-dependent RNA helicase DDX31/DBP7